MSTASLVAKNANGYYIPSQATASAQDIGDLISASLEQGDRWFASVYFNLGEVANSGFDMITGTGDFGDLGVYEITSVTGTTPIFLNLDGNITGYTGDTVAFGHAYSAGNTPGGLLLWRAVQGDEHMIYTNATLSGVGKGAVIGNNPTDLIEEEFEYLTKTYGSNPN